MKRKLLSMALAMCMVFTLFPTAAFATGNVSIGTGSIVDSGSPAVCENHKEHDKDCGYAKAVEGTDCTHLNEDGTYSCGQTVSGNEATPSDAEYVCDHSDDCGYIEAVEGADCTHECELCKPAEVEKPAKPEVPTCDCTVKCTAADAENEVEAGIDADCPVCGVKNADLAACKGEMSNTMKAPRTGDITYNDLGDTGATISATLSADGTFTLTGTGRMKEIGVNDRPWNGKIEDITTVFVSSGITYISGGCFVNCSNLTSITFEPDSQMSEIGSFAFSTTGLTSVALPTGITKIGDSAFSQSKLTSLVIPASVKTLDSCSFSDNPLETVTFEKGIQLETIESVAFARTALKSIEIPASVKKIDIEAFAESALEHITFEEGTQIEEFSLGVFVECKALESIEIPASVKNIDWKCFAGCSALKSVTFRGATAPTLDTDVFVDTSADLKITVPTGATGYDTGNWKTLYDAGKIVQGKQITQTLDFTDTGARPADCHASPINHNHDGDKCFTWDSGTTTLTLNNLNLETSADIAIKLPAGATVNMGAADSDSKVTSMYNSTNGTDGIYGAGALTFEGSGTLTATGGTSTDTASYGVYAGGNITVSGGTLNATGREVTASVAGISCGVNASGGSITVSGGTLNATSQAAGGNSYGANAYTNIAVSGTGTLNATGGDVGYTGLYSCGVYTTNGDITVSGGTLTATGGQSGLESCGAYIISGNITVSSGTLEAKSTSTTGAAVNTAPDTSGYANVKLSAGTAVDNLSVVTDLSGFATYKHIKIEQDAAAGTKITAPLDFTSVTSNKDCTMATANGGSNHTHADGVKCWEWAYDAAGSTLKLNNVDIEITSGSHFGGINLPAGANIILFTGTNRIIGTDNVANAIYSLSGSVTLTGADDNAVLNASGRNCGINAPNNTVTITGGTVNAFGKDTSGINGQSGVTISGGTVTATTDSTDSLCAAIWAGSGNISLAGGSVTAKAGAGAKPFLKEPTLTNMVHDATSGTWDNTAGTACTYKPGTASATYTITFNANGGSVSPTSSTTGADGKLTGLPTPTRSGSYRFDGWYTAASGGTAVTTATVFSTNSTIYAHWTYTGGSDTGDDDSSSGSGSSNSGSNITVTTPPADKPNLPTQGEIKVDAKVEDGVAAINITDKNINDAFDKALADAKKNGNEANGITLVLHVNTGNETVNSATVNLPKTAQETIISRKIVNTMVVVNNPDIKIGMDLTAVTEINKQANADVNITTTRMDGSKLTDSAKTAIGSRPVFDLAVSYGGGKAISSFGAGSVSVSIPYALQAGEKAGNVQAVYVDANGKVQWLSSSVYDSVNQVVLFGTSHFSTYGVGYKQDAPAFTDSTNHWAKDDIQFVVNRGLLAGTSATTFSPDTAMTRGMFVTALGRLANADVSSYKQSSFPDVKADSYYMGYIEWASKNGILSGGMDGKFNPDASITREQMAVIMTGYAKAIGFTTPKVHAENTFADIAKINSYAKTAVKQMQMAGVLAGKNSNIFDPQGIVTRAEASAILRRFVALAISSDACQGWTMNDSGQWMYYENGKPVTGKKDIGGASYTFDQYGVTA